jgi:hypothetical protein
MTPAPNVDPALRGVYLREDILKVLGLPKLPKHRPVFELSPID